VYLCALASSLIITGQLGIFFVISLPPSLEAAFLNDPKDDLLPYRYKTTFSE
jgi:hypothetical protein